MRKINLSGNMAPLQEPRIELTTDKMLRFAVECSERSIAEAAQSYILFFIVKRSYI